MTPRDKPRLDPSRLRELSQLRPARAAAQIALEWTAIVTAAALCWTFWHPLVYVLTVAFIGARQHSLAILVHDGAHFRLARNRRANDWLSDTLCAWPLLLVTTAGYRRNHNAHHRWLNSEQDPDWRRKQTPEWKFPQSKTRFVFRLAAYALGWGLVRSLVIIRSFERTPANRRRGRDTAPSLARVAFLAAVAVTVSVAGIWQQVALFWLVPLVTWTQLALQVRSVAEHFAIPERDGQTPGTRTTIPTILGRLFIGSANVGYHFEHHSYPSVPFYNLPLLHAELVESDEYHELVHVTRGYARVVMECVR